MLSETEMIKEQRQLIAQLKGIHSHYGNFHTINLLTELVGVLPDDKTKLLSVIDTFLAFSNPLKHNFILGKRLGYYHHLADFQKSPAYDSVQQQVEKFQRENPESIEAIFHELRNLII